MTNKQKAHLTASLVVLATAFILGVITLFPKILFPTFLAVGVAVMYYVIYISFKDGFP